VAAGSLALVVLAVSALATASKPPCEYPWEEHINVHFNETNGEHYDVHNNHCHYPD